MNLIDTHCHLDADEFSNDLSDVLARAMSQSIKYFVVPAISINNCSRVQQLAQQYNEIYYALGIHPLFIPQAKESDLLTLKKIIETSMSDPKLVAIGEIGLDFFVPALNTKELIGKQEFFLKEQLTLAKQFGLPVILHTRKSQDKVLKLLRQVGITQGIAHAFNGSLQQAKSYINQGLKLGFGGAMTWSRATKIRELARILGLSDIVLETDSPDMPPAWLVAKKVRNEPAHLARIAQTLAEIRETSIEEIMHFSTQNAFAALSRLGGFSALLEHD